MLDLQKVTGIAAKQEKEKVNPRNINQLDNDAFMKLFLEQLKNQDPTAPMETDKIVTQTAQLTQVEMQEQQKKTMVEVAEAMKSVQDTNKELKDFQAKMQESLGVLNDSMKQSVESNQQAGAFQSLSSISMIGKIAETDVFGINYKEGENVNFSVYFDESIDTSKSPGTLHILNAQNELVSSIDLSAYNGKKGYVEFSFDGLDSNGEKLPSGVYNIQAEYNLGADNKPLHARIGRGEVQSIIFDKGAPMIRMNDMILPFQSAMEFYNKQ